MATLNVTIDPTGAVVGGAAVENALRDVRDETRNLATAVKRNVDTAFQSATRRSRRNLTGLNRELARVVSVAGRLGSVLGIGSGVAIGAGFIRGARSAEEFNVAVSDLSAITGAVGDDLRFLSDSARDMGSATSFSATQAAQAYQLIASAKPELLGNAEALEEVTRQTLTLAAAAGTTLPQAADIAATSLNQFGAGADQAARFINVLAAGSKFGASLVTETAAALKNAGVSARSAGISFEVANAAIQVFARDGIRGGEAGTALRNIILKLEQQAESFRPSVQGLAGALRNLGEEELTTTELTRLFGLENVNAAQAILRNVGLLESLTDQLTGTSVATEQAETRLDNLTGDLKLLGSALNETFIQLTEDPNTFSRRFVQGLTDMITAVNEFNRTGQITVDETRYGVLIDAEANRLNALREDLQEVRSDIAAAQTEQQQFLRSEVASNFAESVSNAGLEVMAISDEWGNVDRMILAVDGRVESLQERIRDLFSQVRQNNDNIFGGIFQRARGNEDLLRADIPYGSRFRDDPAAIQHRQYLREQVFATIDALEERNRLEAEGSDLQLRALASAARQRRDFQRVLDDNSQGLQNLIDNEQSLSQELLATTVATIDNTASIALNAGARMELVRATRELRNENERAREEFDADTRDAFDPLSEFRALNLPQLARRTRRLRADLRTPQEELDFQREFLGLLHERGVLNDELHARAIAQAEERFAAETRTGDSLHDQSNAYQQLLGSLDPVIAAQQEYQASSTLLDEVEKNRAELGIDLAEILEARVLIENRLADAIEGVTDATTVQEQAQRRVISRYLPLRRAQEQYNQALKDIEDANLGVVETEQAKINALREYERAVGAASNASAEYADQSRRGFDDVQSNIEEFTNNFTRTINDALTGGEASFSNFFDSIERMIVERFTQRFIAEPLNELINNLIGGSGSGGSSFLGDLARSFFGGSFGSSTDLIPYSTVSAPLDLGGGGLQYGGVARPGRSYIVGEAGPEILRQGRSGGYVTPIGNPNRQGIAPAEVRVEVNNYNSEQSDVQIADRTGPDGEQVIEVAVLNAFDRSIATGALDRRLGLYGARRETIPRS